MDVTHFAVMKDDAEINARGYTGLECDDVLAHQCAVVGMHERLEICECATERARLETVQTLLFERPDDATSGDVPVPQPNTRG